jgi:hypothetical protein
MENANIKDIPIFSAYALINIPTILYQNDEANLDLV